RSIPSEWTILELLLRHRPLRYQREPTSAEICKQSLVALTRLIHAHSRDSQMWVYKALICMDDLVSRPSRSPDRCELRHVSAIRFPAGCPVRLAGCWRQAGGGRV